MTDLTALTVWIAILAIAAAVQTLLLIGGALMGLRAWRELQNRLDALETQRLEPLTAKVNATMQEVSDIVGRLKAAEARIEAAVASTSESLRRGVAWARRRAWPAVGLLRGTRAAVGALSHRSTLTYGGTPRPGR
jgi:hypothetical protein